MRKPYGHILQPDPAAIAKPSCALYDVCRSLAAAEGCRLLQISRKVCTMGQTLSEPETTKHTSYGGDDRLAWAVSEMQGWRLCRSNSSNIMFHHILGHGLAWEGSWTSLWTSIGCSEFILACLDGFSEVPGLQDVEKACEWRDHPTAVTIA